MMQPPDFNCFCQCGFEAYAFTDLTCPNCGKTMKCPEGHKAASETWPKWARLLKLMRTEADSGVGDTAQRVAAKMGGEGFKAFASRLGIPCGCSERQADWNKRFPYT